MQVDWKHLAARHPDVRIERLELTPIHVPFREPVRKLMAASEGGLGMAIGAEEPWTGGDFVIARLVAGNGAVGWGEAYVWLPETGVLPHHVLDVALLLGRYVVGSSPFALPEILSRMDRNVARNEVAKGLIDMACWDLVGRLVGQSVAELIGGSPPGTIDLAALIPLADSDTMTALARMFTDEGYRTLRLKLGKGPAADRERIAAVRELVGSDTRLRVDYNQAYDVATATSAIDEISPFGIDCAEQPVAAGDFVAMAELQRRVKVPLMAHEGCFSLQDIRTLLALDAIGVVGINSERPGGVTRAVEAIELALQRDMGVIIHNQTLGVGTAAQLHLAAAFGERLRHAPEFFGNVMLEHDLLVDPITYAHGSATVPGGAGYGVTVDEDALRGYATGPTQSVTTAVSGR